MYNFYDHPASFKSLEFAKENNVIVTSLCAILVLLDSNHFFNILYDMMIKTCRYGDLPVEFGTLCQS